MYTPSQLSTLLCDLDKEIAYITGHSFESIQFKRKNNQWLTVIKVRMADGRNKVAFIDAPTIEDALGLIYASLHTKQSYLKWYDDRFGG